jgi:transposase
MPKRKRRSFTEEFKQDAVHMLDQPGVTMAEVSRNLGVHVSLLAKWKQNMSGKQQEQNQELAESERLELARLRAEVKRLRMEKDILKKATAFFVNEKP